MKNQIIVELILFPHLDRKSSPRITKRDWNTVFYWSVFCLRIQISCHAMIGHIWVNKLQNIRQYNCISIIVYLISKGYNGFLGGPFVYEYQIKIYLLSRIKSMKYALLFRCCFVFHNKCRSLQNMVQCNSWSHLAE